MFHLRYAYFAMVTAVVLANYLVLFPISDWLTWGAFAYSFTYLITELTNRFLGPSIARRVVYVGFIFASIPSFALSTPRIAIASLLAFLISQLIDIAIFNKYRDLTWWYAPFFSSVGASIVDTFIFFTVAFSGLGLPYMTWALGTLFVKLLMDVILLAPFRIAMRKVPRAA